MTVAADNIKYYASHQPKGGGERTFLFETENGLEWFPLSFVESMQPKPKVAAITMQEAQKITDEYGVALDVHPAVDQPQPVPTPAKESHPPGVMGRIKSGVKGAASGAAKAKIIPGVGTGVGATIGGAAGFFNPPKEEEKKGKRKFSLLIFFLCFALGITLALIIAWNVQPFIKFVEILASKLNFSKFSDLLLNLWVIGFLFAAISRFIFATIGIVLYAICQLIEISPMLYRRNPERMKRTIDAWQQWAKYQINHSDPNAVKKLKADYNFAPIVSYRWMTTACHVTYLFELVVCFVAEPPCNPAWKFPWYLMTFQFGKIDWINVCLMISVLFAAQWVVAGILKLWPEIYPKVSEEFKK